MWSIEGKELLALLCINETTVCNMWFSKNVTFIRLGTM